MQSSEEIMEEMEQRVRDNKPISPASWCEAALRCNQLSGHLDNKLANYEAEMNHIRAEFIKQDIPDAKAKILAQDSVDYLDYLKTKALFKRISEFIKLAKKRAMIEEI